jgi:hypothetical protein
MEEAEIAEEKKSSSKKLISWGKIVKVVKKPFDTIAKIGKSKKASVVDNGQIPNKEAGHGDGNVATEPPKKEDMATLTKMFHEVGFSQFHRFFAKAMIKRFFTKKQTNITESSN